MSELLKQLARLDRRARRVPVLRARLVPRVRRVRPAQRGLKVTRGQPERLDRRERPEQPAQQVLKVTRARPAQLDLRALRARPGRRV